MWEYVGKFYSLLFTALSVIIFNIMDSMLNFLGIKYSLVHEEKMDTDPDRQALDTDPDPDQPPPKLC
jgi:hypothetical protein